MLNIIKEETFQEKRKRWEEKKKEAEAQVILKTIKNFPHMQGITKETRHLLKWKSLAWIVIKDKNLKILKGFFKHPWKYAKNYISSWKNKIPYTREGDFFLYNVPSVPHFKTLLKETDSLLILGFSYCQKPFECPSGRFTSECIRDQASPICSQCFIGKAAALYPEEKTVFLIIPTIHYIGEQIFTLIDKYPDKKIRFIITACELTLEMFGDLGNMVDIQGIGVRLDGRICNTFKAFKLSEEGIKPGLTALLPQTEEAFLSLLCN